MNSTLVRSGPFGASQQIFPQFAVGGPAESHFTVNNPGDSPITVDVELRLSDGSLFRNQSLDVPAAGTVTVVFSAPQIAPVDGWARLSSTGAFTATLFYKIVGVGNVGVLPATPSGQMKLFSFFGPGTATGLALANQNATESSELTVRILDGAGVLQREVSRTLGPLEHDAFFLNEQPYLADLNGSVDILATPPVAAVALRLDGGLLAGVPVVVPGLPIRGQFNEVSPNILGGHELNFVGEGVVGATLGGGGAEGDRVSDPDSVFGTLSCLGGIECRNGVLKNFGTVGGGLGNSSSYIATISGGMGNQAGPLAAVGGGYNNGADALSAIAGGERNEAGPGSSVGGGLSHSATGVTSTVGGGNSNTASGDLATVGGGRQNSASGQHTTVGGGLFNNTSGERATVGGGDRNTASGDNSTVGGGLFNNTSGERATVGGGDQNTASGKHSTVGGGRRNNTSGELATVGGGTLNAASGFSSTVPGGVLNTASGDYSFAAGRRAKASCRGCFVWADANDEDFSPSGAIAVDNRFYVRASGGTFFYSNAELSAGVRLTAGASSWTTLSDRKAKENFETVDPDRLLQALNRIPVSTWNYKAQDDAIRHIGPMAQDFYAAFGVGEDDRHISTVDADGVALAAIQGLYRVLLKTREEMDAVKRELADLKAAIANSLQERSR